MPNRTARERFLSKINKLPDGCWDWTGGRTFFLGKRKDHYHTVTPQRASLVLFLGGGGFVVRCRRRWGCVNPAHIKSSPRVYNRSGTNSPRYDPQVVRGVKAIADEMRIPGQTAQHYADIYGVSREAIRLIRDGRSNGGIYVPPEAVIEIRQNCRRGYRSGYIKKAMEKFKLGKSTVMKMVAGKYDANKPDVA